jgi:tetratricopeptide (TPR) repeat protein
MNAQTPSAPAGVPVLRDRKGQVYTPALSPSLKPLLALLFVGFAFLGATGIYTATINFFDTIQKADYTTVMTMWVVLAHLVGGIVLVLPFVFFGVTHWRSARTRPNRRAVSLGKALFFIGLIVCFSGLALAQVHDRMQLPTGSLGRIIAYWLHIVFPLLAIAVYILHRRAGPDIKYGWGVGWGASVTVFVGAMVLLHSMDPRKLNKVAPKEGDQYFHPSFSRTSDGNFVHADTFMMDQYCMKCHEDIYKDHLHSAHKNSSFNNPAYLFSVRETRKVALERDKNTQASRWCAGCHDPVPFFSGQFDDPNFDDVNNPTAHAGITCTVCHAMTHVNSARGNGDYIIEEPQHYPFAKSENSFLQYLNNQMVKAKPEFHKKTFLKPFHKTAEFCSTCHKVSLPVELNQYREFLRGQNHYDSYLLSGVSGVGTRSFYYPPEAKKNCAECHMPLKESMDFGSKDFDNSGVRKVHNHLFPAANTGLPWMLNLRPDEVRTPAKPEGFRKAALAHADFLRGTDPEGKDKKLRIDLFAIKTGGAIDGKLTVLRPELPKLNPGEKYLVEVVIRTVNMGHPFSQGTVDSNEIWADFKASQKGKVFAQNGGMVPRKTSKGEQKLDERPYMVLDDREVDKASHFVNVLLLDRNGNRINRRNPQDIFTPLYNHQIPPGAGQVVHYALEVPAAEKLAKDDKGQLEPVKLDVRLRYRKFDFEYMALVHGKDGKPDESKVPQLPVVDICNDTVLLPVEGGADVAKQESPIKPAWQRWNDYGIGCFIEGGPGEKRGELKQAMEAFQKVAEIGEKATEPPGKMAKGFGLLNQARVAFDFGDLNRTVDLLDRALKADPPAPWWTVAWLTAKVNIENGKLDEAAAELEKVLDEDYQPRKRKFDFRRDYVILNDLANAYYEMAKRAQPDPKRRDGFLKKSIATFEKALAVDPEDLDAHFGLAQCYTRLGEQLEQQGKPPQTKQEAGELAAVFLDGKQPIEKRLETAQQLAEAVALMGRQKYKTATKLPACNRLWKDLGKVFRDDADPSVRTAAALVLSRVHGELHAVFKPDDLAESRARQLYREKPENKHADRASQSIVIYPTGHQP